MQIFDTEMKEFLLKRMAERKNQGRMKEIRTLGKAYTPDEQIAEAKMGTQAGIEFLMAEKKLHDFLQKTL